MEKLSIEQLTEQLDCQRRLVPREQEDGFTVYFTEVGIYLIHAPGFEGSLGALFSGSCTLMEEVEKRISDEKQERLWHGKRTTKEGDPERGHRHGDPKSTVQASSNPGRLQLVT